MEEEGEPVAGPSGLQPIVPLDEVTTEDEDLGLLCDEEGRNLVTGVLPTKSSQKKKKKKKKNVKGRMVDTRTYDERIESQKYFSSDSEFDLELFERELNE